MKQQSYFTRLDKIIIVFALIGAILLGLCVFSGCNSNIGFNKQILDLNYQYTRAVIRFSDGDMEIRIKSWNDYDDSDMIQITATDGTVYYTHGSNVILIADPR